ncbi:hypothetical protein N7532_004922 [Penicillium argentinense]|uniref:Zn(2)-C6 fungal-type domain-containing protein n=1 Tax=Penicillium argentinense TaxID=1131581 RepID=A0A9W9K9V1_9EURO|nr:uncharacterized protein N7532_004922 [Penicillium argentinense]KAJ5097921.1 hypothetical protein N7532_004922 [Penicillium argentinense]
MQPLVLHPPSLTSAQFGQPRFNSGPERLPLNRSWSTNARGCSPRAPLPRQSMSGSPPTQEPSVTSGESRPVAYPSASSPVFTTGVLAIPAVSGTSQPPAAVSDPLSAPILPRYGEPGPPPFVGSPIQHQHQNQHQHPHQHPHQHQHDHPHQHQHPHTHQQQHPHSGEPPFSLSTLEPAVPGPSTRSLAQKSTRRTKAHVASACVNCKKKHLGCDPARPCRRCVLAGKAASCVDVTHKKRGRPPLKAEDSSLRAYTTHIESPGVSAEAQPSMAAQRNVLHRATSSRELRPMPDPHTIGDPGPTAATMRMQRSQAHRWSASVFPLTRPMDPSTSIPGSAGRRPFSSSGPASYTAVPPHPPPAFVPVTGGFNPVLKTGAMPPGMDRRFPPYGGPALPPPTSPPQHQHPAGVSYLPYADAPSSVIHQPMSDSRIPPAPREPYLESPFRLPPIHQATASPISHHAHRLSDPYPASWTTSSSSREDNPREPRSPATLQRPMSSLLSHSTPQSYHHQRSSSTTGPLEPIPRHLGPIDLPSPVPLSHSSPITTQAAHTSTEAETGEPRPIKRRKMALDDMVNG